MDAQPDLPPARPCPLCGAPMAAPSACTGTSALCVFLEREEHDFSTMAVKLPVLGQAARLGRTCKRARHVCKKKAEQRFQMVLAGTRRREQLRSQCPGAVALCIALRHSEEIEDEAIRSTRGRRPVCKLMATCFIVKECVREGSPTRRSSLAAAWRRSCFLTLRGMVRQRAAMERMWQIGRCDLECACGRCSLAQH